MKTVFKKYAPAVLFFAFMVWMIILADTNDENILATTGRQLPFGDKVGHFLIFGFQALLLNRALEFKRFNFGNFQPYIGSIVVLTFAFCEEFSQLAFSSRNFDVMDMLFDLLGVLFFSSVMFRSLIPRLAKLVSSEKINNTL